MMSSETCHPEKSENIFRIIPNVSAISLMDIANEFGSLKTNSHFIDMRSGRSTEIAPMT